MSFFKRNKNESLIPPVAEPAGLPSGPARGTSPRPGGLPSRPNAGATYNKSRDGDLSYNPPNYRNAPTYNATPAPSDAWAPPAPVTQSRSYNRQNAVGDQYTRGDANIDQDRAELFGGYKPKPGGSGRFFDGPGLENEPAPGEENEEDVEGIKQQTRFVKQESVNSTRNALRMAREAEETARNTMLKLGDQSGTCSLVLVYETCLISVTEKLANTERHLDVAKGHSHRADDRTDELKQLNRSIFRPVITFNKDGKRRAQEEKMQARFEEDRAERERTMTDIRESQNRIGRASGYGQDDDNYGGGDADGGIRGRFKTQEQQAARKAQRSRYQFEATASDDELEDELDDNLDEIHGAVKRMKALGLAMNQELDNQNDRIDRIGGKADKLGMRVDNNTERVCSSSIVGVLYGTH
jgi:protein transport protein SEC9